MENATVRVRPLRFAFVVEPNDKAGLQRIFETNSALWGGLFNFIIPWGGTLLAEAAGWLIR